MLICPILVLMVIVLKVHNLIFFKYLSDNYYYLAYTGFQLDVSFWDTCIAPL